MTQSIPSITNDLLQTQRLMELIEAEDAANGEVGCGIPSDKLSKYLDNRSININGENLRQLLREHLGHILTERDFDAIISQVSRHICSMVAEFNESISNVLQTSEVDGDIIEHISNTELKKYFQSELEEFLSKDFIEQIIQRTHSIIHQSVLQPRHSWLSPIWVFKGSEKLYIASSATLHLAIENVKAQYPHIVGELEVVKVGGILAPNQVVEVDY
ncbi:hypothetical protein [Calothrix sp. PCC 6303]|uniref:hypothetical protein n=1 Tax=Calothrix sp. PCC 6303 TaxID=1170562 RepID=UPI0002A00305|nr:hypothetical protein [Calothrix sp. PCC 6303]AFZ04524.1 hypothetical protein Cal6303_5648 [Calothrix sp. PCC 6303]